MLGMSLATFTLLHTVISLVGIVSGLVVLGGMFKARRMPNWTAAFLVTTILTSVTGFMFPFKAIGPPHIVGAISLLILALSVLALYLKGLAGSWRGIYVVTAVAALYLNVFVAIVQAFQKIGPLNALAPKGNEPPFAIAQGVAFLLFVWFGFHALRGFRPAGTITMAAGTAGARLSS